MLLIPLTKGRGPVCSLSARMPPLYSGLSVVVSLPWPETLESPSTSALLASWTRGAAALLPPAARGEWSGEASAMRPLARAPFWAGEGVPRFFAEGAFGLAAALWGLRPVGAFPAPAAPAVAPEGTASGPAGEVTVPCLVTTIADAA